MFFVENDVMNDNKINSNVAMPVLVNPKSSAEQVAEQALIKPVDAIAKAEAKDNRADRAEAKQVDMDHAVERIEGFVQSVQRDLEFSQDESTGDSVVTVRDRQTNEVIRQIPNEEMLDIAKRLDEIGGVLFSVSA